MDNNTVENNTNTPTQATEIYYGPDSIPQPDFPKADWNPNKYQFDKLEPTPFPTTSINTSDDPFTNEYKSFENRFYKRGQKMNYGQMGAPTAFNAENTLFDKFKSSYDFSDKGFSPWRDNDDTYNQDTNVLKELYRSTKWAAPLFGEGFTSGLRTFPDLIQGAYNFDWDQIIKSDDQLANKWARATKMGGSTADGISSFVTNFEISAANMLGLVAETFVENALIGYVTAQSGGSTAPLAVAEVGKTASVFYNVYKGIRNLNKIGDIFKEANNARRFYEITVDGAKAFGKGAINFLNPLEQITKLAIDAKKGEDYYKQSTTLGKTLLGFGAFYRDLREINFALTEAKLEGGFSYLERSNEMTNKYISENGFAPQGKDAQDIEINARRGGDFTTQLNLPVIYFSNRFGFGNLFKGWTPLNKLMADAALDKTIFKNITFESTKKLFEEAKKFSLKKSFKLGLGNSLNYFKANYMEGIQENLQDVIQGAATDYYDKQFKDSSYGGYMIMLGDIGNQFGKKVFTGQGLETFASGALMGLVMQGGIKATSGVQNLTYRLIKPEQYKEFKDSRKEQINKYVTQLNEIYKDPTKYLDPQLMNAVRQGELTKYLSQSIKNGNKKEFYDIKDQAVYEHLMTMARSGKTEIFKDRLEEMKQLTPDEFENALGFKVENPAEFKSYIDDQIKKVDRIQDLYDKANENFKNPINLSAYKKDSKEYINASQQYLAFENAKQQAIFANYSFMRNTERMSDLLTQMAKVKVMGKSSYTDLSKITDSNLLDKEISILKKEIDNLTQTNDKDSKDILKEKLDKLKALEIWKGVMDSPQLEKNPVVAINKQNLLLESGAPTKPIFPIDYPSVDNPAYENWRSAAKLAFEKLVQVDADTKKDIIYREGIDSVFDTLMDYHTLNRESKGMMEMINILADPQNFLRLYEGHFSVIRDLQFKRFSVLLNAIKKALTVSDENSLINLLAKNNFVEDPENPGKYFKISDLSSVEPDSEDAKKIEELIKDFKEQTNLDDVIETPEIVPGTAASVSDIEALVLTEENYNNWSNIRDKSDYNSFVDQVKSALSTFDQVKDKSKITPENVESSLSTIKAFPKSIRNQVIPLIVDKYKTATPAPVSATSILNDILNVLNLIEPSDLDSEDLKVLDKILNTYLNPKSDEYKLLTDAERNTLLNKYNSIMSIEINKLYDETDPIWIIEYNQTNDNVKEALKKPNLTDEEIKGIFDFNYLPVINKLKDKAVKGKYRNKIKEARDKYLLKINTDKKSKDVEAMKLAVENIFKNNKSLSDIEDAVFLLTLNSEIKEEVFKKFEEELKKRFNDEISKLEEFDGTIKSEAANFYIKFIESFKKDINESLARYKIQAEKIAEKTEGFNLAVGVDEYYENDIHKGILKNQYLYGASPTIGQINALENLVSSGVLLLNEIENIDFLQDASEIINLGVTRIFTIGINKGMLVYKKTGKIDLLKSELTDYLKKGSSSVNKITDPNFILDNVKSGKFDTAEVLKQLAIPETGEIDDETFKLFKELRNSIYNVQEESKILNAISILELKKDKFIKDNILPSLTDFISKDDAKLLSNYLNNKENFESFYDDLIELIENLQTVESLNDSNKLIAQFVRKNIKSYKIADAARIIKVYIGGILEIQNSISSEPVVGVILSDEEIIAILNGESRVVTPEQIKQVKAYEKDLIEIYKNKFFSAPSYTEMSLEYDGENLEFPKGYVPGLKYLALRPKFATDVRTTEDLTTEYNVVNNKINIRFALEKIINSDFATESEKELANVLLYTFNEDDTLDVNNDMESAGEWDSERVSVNLIANGYNTDFPSNSIETVLLHELVHAKTEEALKNPDGNYTKAIKSLYAAVKENPNSKSFYTFKQGMSEDEYLREFVSEALTNPAFQRLLATIPYAKSGKSSWQKFLDILTNLLKSIGINIEGTILNEVINQTTELIKYDYTEKVLTKLYTVNSIEEINKLKEEINKEGTILLPNILESINSALESKRNSILATEINEKAKTMTQIKVDGKTYYLKFVNNDIEVYKKTNKKLARVREASVIEKIIESKIKELGVIKFLGKDNIEALQSLMGDPKERGSYASGQMDETPLSESRLSNALNADVVLRFESIDDLKNFRKDYWAFVRKRRDAKYRSIDALRKAYPGRGINSYIDIVEGLGGLNLKNGVNLTDKKIDRLINNGILRINMKGAVHEDYVDDDENPVSIDDFLELYNMILNGVPIESSDYDVVKLKINKMLKDIFGATTISDKTQKFIENKINDSLTYDIEEDLEDEPDIQLPPIESEVIVFDSKDNKKGQTLTPSESPKTPNDITAKNKNALRSYSFDLNWDNETESNFFKEHYYKIRNIINILSLKPITDLANIYVTLDNDIAELRWDGSAQSTSWINANKGIVGYLSDKNGNPYVFNSKGEIIDTISRKDLTNTKDLNNGDNQIIYFTTVSPTNKTIINTLTEESKELLFAARNKILIDKIPQISKLAVITQGEMNTNSLRHSDSSKQKNTKRDSDFYDQLSQDHVSLEINNTGKLNAVIKGSDNSINRIGLYTPATRNIYIGNEKSISLFDHLIELMVTYNEMKLRGEDTSRFDSFLFYYVQNMWLTGDKEYNTLKIPQHLKSINIKNKKNKVLDENFTSLEFIKIVNGKVVIDDQMLYKARIFMENKNINISKKWLSGEVPFWVPYVTEVNSNKTINFVNMNYKKFLFKQVGLNSNDRYIPSVDEIKRYNSIIEFTNPENLIEEEPSSIEISEQQIIDNIDVVKDEVNKKIEENTNKVKVNEDQKNKIKNSRKYNAPSYNQIFEKTC